MFLFAYLYKNIAVIYHLIKEQLLRQRVMWWPCEISETVTLARIDTAGLAGSL